jgi:hypothetical protein
MRKLPEPVRAATWRFSEIRVKIWLRSGFAGFAGSNQNIIYPGQWFPFGRSGPLKDPHINDLPQCVIFRPSMPFSGGFTISERASMRA